MRKIRSGVARHGADLKRQFFPDVSYRTIRRELQKMGLNGRRRRRTFFLRKIHIQKRQMFALAYQNWSRRDWRKVVFSDESKFTLFGSDGVQYCRRGPNEEFLPQNVDPKVKYGGGKVNVWGCITPVGFGRLHRVEGNLNAKQYVKILEESYLGTLRDHGLAITDIVFQQDNDSKHTSKLASQWFTDHGVTLLGWPPNSPDMNIIEHAWGELEHRVHAKYPHLSNVNQLWEALQSEWALLGEDYKNVLYDSMPRRVRALQAVRGRQTKY